MALTVAEQKQLADLKAKEVKQAQQNPKVPLTPDEQAKVQELEQRAAQ